jgi:hypothetical protein
MLRSGSRWLSAAAISSVIAFAGAPASAQPPGATPAGPTSAVPPKSDSADPTERARVHYERGLQLFNEENYDAALFEFDRAYELAPSYKILYNMGRIQRQQNNYAAAMRSYTRYLHEGGGNVPADRRKEVETEIGVLKPRVANIKVTVNVDGADVYADDIPVCTATIESSCVGKSPLQAPIIVNGGRHKITATKKGYAPATSLVSVVGSDEIDVKLDLVSYDRPVAPAKNPWVVPTIIGWGVTGAGLATAIITGVMAGNAKDDQAAAVERFGATRAELDEAKDKTNTLGTVTDGVLIGTGVLAVVSTYLTIKAIRWKGEASSVNVEVGANRVGLGGRF